MALPDRPDEAQLRRQARELQRAARAGEPEARARLRAHGLDPATGGLRRAQHVLAREHGHRSWSELLATLAAASGDHEGRSPWDRAAPAPRPPLMEPVVAAATEIAERIGSHTLAGEHLVLAATDPQRPGRMELSGLDRGWLQDWVARSFAGGRVSDGARPWPTSPAFEEHLALAAGLSVAGGLPVITPAALAVAGLYAGFGTPLWVDSGGVDPDEAAEELSAFHRLAVYPAHLEPPRSPRGDLVYYPSGSPGVTQELIRRYPPGHGTHWGVNSSTWKPGFHWVWGDDDIPMLGLVRSVLADPSLAEAVPWREGHRREAEARGQRDPGDARPLDGASRRPLPGSRRLSRPESRSPAGLEQAPASGSLGPYRAAARALAAAIEGGEPSAAARVLAHHPLYVGRDPGRLDLGMLRLADAYATVAAEAGFGSWPELVAAADTTGLGAPRRRWAGAHSDQAVHRAMREASQRRDPGLRPAHIVLALLQADPPDQATEALALLGVTLDAVTARLGPEGDPADTVGLGSTPTWHALRGWAAGLALGRGADRIEPPDVLLALAYGLAPGDVATEVGADPDAAHDALAELGHPVPPILPSEIWASSDA